MTDIDTIGELVLILSNGELTVWQEPRKAALTLAHAVIANKLLAENQLHEARHHLEVTITENKMQRMELVSLRASLRTLAEVREKYRDTIRTACHDRAYPDGMIDDEWEDVAKIIIAALDALETA